MQRLMVTGASGFIGSNCLTQLPAGQFEVHVLSRKTSSLFTNLPVKQHGVDLFDESAMHAVMNRVRPTHLLHLAWYAVPGKFWTAAENVHWVEASLHLLRAFADFGGRRAVVAGSCAEYAWNDLPCDEYTTSCQPTSLYGRCKHLLHKMASTLAESHDFSLAWARIFFLHGPNEHPQRLVSSIMRSLLQGEPALGTAGWQERDFLHVEDVARALVALLGTTVTGPVNIGSGKSVPVRTLQEILGKLIGRSDLLRLGALQMREDEPLRLVANNQRLRTEVGWTQRYSLEAGLEQHYRWLQQATHRQAG